MLGAGVAMSFGRDRRALQSSICDFSSKHFGRPQHLFLSPAWGDVGGAAPLETRAKALTFEIGANNVADRLRRIRSLWYLIGCAWDQSDFSKLGSTSDVPSALLSRDFLCLGEGSCVGS